MDRLPHDLRDDSPAPQGPISAFVLPYRTLAAVLGGLLVVAAVVAVVPSWRSQALLSLTKRTESFTTVAFSDLDPTDACRRARAGTVSFSVTNDEGRAVGYRYRVSVTPSSGDVAVTTGDLRAGAGESLGVEAPVPARARDVRELRVELVGRTEHLSLTCSGGTR